MASIKQIQHRLKQSQSRLQRLNEKKVDTKKKLSTLKDGDASRDRTEQKLAKLESECSDAESTCDRLLKDLKKSEEAAPKSSKKKTSSKSSLPSSQHERLDSIQSEIIEMKRFEKQLELAQNSNLDRFKQIQLQIRDLTKFTDRLLVIESQLREIQLDSKDQSPKKKDSKKDLFGEEEKGMQDVFQPQSATTSLAGEPLSSRADKPWPWPKAMSQFLKGWLRGRKWWGHEDWLGLLRQISIQEFSRFSQREHHGQIGAFLEKYRTK